MLAIDDLFTSLTPAGVMSTFLSLAQSLGLTVSAWQSGQPGRTIWAICAQKISDVSQIIPSMNKGGFLDPASTVTPEGGPGWLDLLAKSVFNVVRTPATYATTPLTFTAVAAAGGVYQPGQMHATTAGGNTYKNDAVLTIPANGVVTVSFSADVAGAASSAGIGAISALVTALIGVTVTNPAAAVGSDAETNANLVTRCRSKLASLSVAGPSGAYDYNARTINDANQVQVSSGALVQPASPVTRSQTVTNPATGAVTLYVASAVGAYASPPNHTGVVAKNIVSSTNANGVAIAITMGAGHGIVTGDTLYVTGHLVNTLANGTWSGVTVVGNVVTISQLGNGAGAGGATGTAYRQSDLDLIDKSVQTNAVPDAVSETTLSATGVNLAIVGTLTVTGATASLTDAQINALIATSAALFAAGVPLGGYAGSLSLELVRNAVFNTIPASDRVDLALTSPAGATVVAAGVVVQVSPAPALVIVRV